MRPCWRSSLRRTPQPACWAAATMRASYQESPPRPWRRAVIARVAFARGELHEPFAEGRVAGPLPGAGALDQVLVGTESEVLPAKIASTNFVRFCPGLKPALFAATLFHGLKPVASTVVARTHDALRLQGLKPESFAQLAARLNSCPDAKAKPKSGEDQHGLRHSFSSRGEEPVAGAQARLFCRDYVSRAEARGFYRCRAYARRAARIPLRGRGLKPESFAQLAARLNSCPDTRACLEVVQDHVLICLAQIFVAILWLPLLPSL